MKRLSTKFASILLGVFAFSYLALHTTNAAGGSISHVEPQSVKIGQNVTISGSGFGNTRALSTVCIGNSCIYGDSNYSSWSGNQIVFTVPSYFSDSGQLKVSLYNSTESLYGDITGPAMYTSPVLSKVSPVILFQGQEITLSSSSYGGSFGSAQGSVLVGGQAASIKSWSSYSIVAYIPINASTGIQNVVVRNPGGGESDAKQITVKAAPVWYNLNPSQVTPGVTRTCIEGSNFGTAEENWNTSSEIIVGGVSITSAAWSDTKICFTVPESIKQSGNATLKVAGFQLGSRSFTLTASGSSNPYFSKPNDEFLNKQYYLDKINAYSGWSVQSKAQNVVVAIIDDGIYIGHPDLKANIWVNSNEQVGNKRDDDGNGYSDDIYGWDFISNNGEMTTRGSHGTHVAGIIGAVSNNTQGIAGLAWNVRLMPLIACSSSGCSEGLINKAIRYAADNGAQVINISLGSTGTTAYSTGFDEAVRYAYNKGVVIVAAAGNGDIESSSGQDLSLIPQSPVCNDNGQNMVLGVSAVDDQDNFTRWANYGRCVDVVAPGLSIYSTGVPIYDDGQFYSSEAGTSFSTPMVAGLAALVKAKYPDMSNSEVIARIIRNAAKRSTYQIASGIGTIDIAKTLQDMTSYIPQSSQANMPGGHGIGTNIKTSDGTIYMIAPDGTRRPYTSAGAFLSYGFNNFTGVIGATTVDLSLPVGTFIPPRDGKIICSDRGSDKGTCYLITEGKKAGFTSEAVFKGLGFNFKYSSSGDVSWMDSTTNIDSIQVAHNAGVLVNNSGTLQLITGGGVLGIPNVDVFKSWGYTFSDAVLANAADKALSQVGVLRPRSAGELMPKN